MKKIIVIIISCILLILGYYIYNNLHYKEKDDKVIEKDDSSVDKISLDSLAFINIDDKNIVYDGKNKEPKISVSIDNDILKENKDYIVSYSNNINAGYAKVTVYGKGKYNGKASKSFKIEKSDNLFSIKNASLYVLSKNNLDEYVSLASKVKVNYNLKSQTTIDSKLNRNILNIGSLAANDDSDGEIVITVSSDGDSNYNSSTKEMVVNVKKHVRKISFKNMSTSFKTGDTINLGINEDIDGVIFSSSNTNVAVINGSELVAVGGGTSIITATVPGTPTVKAMHVSKKILVDRKKCNAPSNVAVDTNGNVRWTNSNTAIGYEISTSKDKGYVKFSNGDNYLKSIVSSVGKRNVYVRSICDSSIYDDNSSPASSSIDVYRVSLKAGDGIRSVSGEGNYIVDSVVTLDATVLDNNTWSKWVRDDGSIYSTSRVLTIVVKNNINITAVAKSNGYVCSENYYLPANSTSCKSCLDGYWCSGGTFYSSDTDQGIYTRDTLCDKLIEDGAESIDYETFTSKFDKASNSDNYYSIKAAHDCANKHSKQIIVSNNKTYNIYMKSDSADPLETIKVRTSTNLNNSTIYIHDESDIVKKSGMSGNIYEIINDDSRERIYAKSFINNIASGQTISQFSGRGKALVTIKDNNRKVFKRSGANEASDGAGDSAYDVFRVDNDGKILDPLFWSYDSIDTSNDTIRKNIEIYIYPISEGDPLSFKNAHFYNIVDSSDYSDDDIYANYGYAHRGILLKRSNSTIENIYHGFVDENHEFVSNTTYGYNGFFTIGTSADINLKDLEVQALKVNSNHKSSYDLYFNGVAGINISRVRMNEFDGENQLKDRDYWGVTGTNYSKNVVYDGCSLNRIDTHRGVYNLTVNDSVVGTYGLNQVGYGNMNVNRVKVKYTNQFIRLRDDYGSTWNGSINVNNCEIMPDNNNPVYLISARITYDNDGYVHDYGYDLRIPDVNLNGFKVYNNSNDFYVFNISETVNKTNGNLKTIKDNYIRPNSFNFDYPSNHDIVTSNVESCVSNDNSVCSSINTHRYVNEFDSDSASQLQTNISFAINKIKSIINDLFK